MEKIDRFNIRKKGMHINVLEFILLVYLFLGIYGVCARNNTNSLYYVVSAGILFLTFVLCTIKNKKLIIPGRNKLDIIPLCFMMLWIYGVIIGLLRQNKTEYIFRNFAGMLLYLVYYIFVAANVSKMKVEKVVKTVIIMVSIFTPIAFLFINRDVNSFIRKIPILNCFYLNHSESGYIAVMFYCTNFLIAGYVVCLYKSLHSKKKMLIYIVGTLYCAAAILVCSRCGGTEVAVLGMTAVVVVMDRFSKGKKVLLFSLAIAFLIVFVQKLGIDPIRMIMDSSDAGNSIRYKQIDYVLKNLSFFGMGLGAEYSEIGKSYAIEVQYLDFIYKFGASSIILYICYFISFVKAIDVMRTGDGTSSSIYPLAILGGLFIGIGNPVLLSANAVMSHVVSLYLIRKKQIMDSPVDLHLTAD